MTKIWRGFLSAGGMETNGENKTNCHKQRVTEKRKKMDDGN